MANTVTGFLQTLVAAASEASRILAPTWSLASSCYWDYKPQETNPGLYATLNVMIPTDPSASVDDQGIGDTTLNDIGFSTVTMVMDHHPSFSYVVRDFEQFNSPVAIRNLFLDAALKAVKNNINKNISNLITLANFPTNTWDTSAKHFAATSNKAFYPAIGASGKVLGVSEFLSPSSTAGGLMARLSDLYVPVADNPANMSLILNSTPYGRLLDPTTSGAYDPAWTQALIAGQNIAERAHTTGTFGSAFGATIKLDQQLPTSGASPTRTFTGLYMHRYAIAVVTRPLPVPDPKVVACDYVMMTANSDYNVTTQPGEMRLPIRIMAGYNQYPKQGYIVTVDAGYGLKVVRESMAIPFTIAE